MGKIFDVEVGESWICNLIASQQLWVSIHEHPHLYIALGKSLNLSESGLNEMMEVKLP